MSRIIIIVNKRILVVINTIIVIIKYGNNIESHIKY